MVQRRISRLGILVSCQFCVFFSAYVKLLLVMYGNIMDYLTNIAFLFNPNIVIVSIKLCRVENC